MGVLRHSLLFIKTQENQSESSEVLRETFPMVARVVCERHSLLSEEVSQDRKVSIVSLEMILIVAKSWSDSCRDENSNGTEDKVRPKLLNNNAGYELVNGLWDTPADFGTLPQRNLERVTRCAMCSWLHTHSTQVWHCKHADPQWNRWNLAVGWAHNLSQYSLHRTFGVLWVPQLECTA